MYSFGDLPWMKIHEFLLSIGNVREPKEFCVQVIQRIYPLIPYDQARVYFFDDSGKIYDEFLIGVEQRWSDIYREYYSRIDHGRYAIPARRHAITTRIESGCYAIPKIEGGVYDWAKYECDEFITDYIRPQRLRYSAGFGLHNATGLAIGAYCLDRTSHSGYTRKEIDIMGIIQPHLDNLHQNLFVLTSKDTPVRNPEGQQLLTKRELEIAELLCRGLTPTKISGHLCLSLSTVYRHIANMHTKLNVSNRQELLLKLMNMTQ
jgi:DNA-binding CsgD family transcriptional regulator